MVRKDSSLAMLMHAWEERRVSIEEFRQLVFALTEYLPERFVTGSFREVDSDVECLNALVSDLHQYQPDPELLAELRDGEEHPEWWLGDVEVTDSIAEACRRLLGESRRTREDNRAYETAERGLSTHAATELLWDMLLNGRVNLAEFACLYLDLVRFDTYRYRPSNDQSTVQRASEALAHLGHYCGKMLLVQSMAVPGQADDERRLKDAEEQLRGRITYTASLFASLSKQAEGGA